MIKNRVLLKIGKVVRKQEEQLCRYLFPDRCITCNAIMSYSNQAPTCSNCSEYKSIIGRICPYCNSYVSKTSCECEDNKRRHPLKAIFALTGYDKQCRILIHQLKYAKRRSLGRSMGLWLGWEICKSNYCNPDYIVPIPLYKDKERERGFNQSFLIAKYTARVLEKPVKLLLRKDRHNSTQTTLSRSERFDNVKQVFSVKADIERNGTVLLVDDVYSTGATMKEAALTLSKVGKIKIYGAVIGFNPLNMK